MTEADETEDLRRAATVAATTGAQVTETIARELAERRREAAWQAEREAASDAALLAAVDRGVRSGEFVRFQPGDSYDSLQARADRAARIGRAGVPVEAKDARVTADKMNGTDPTRAASSPTMSTPAPAAAKPKARAKAATPER